MFESADEIPDLHLESDFTEPSAWCPNPGQWTSMDADAAESEVIAFLHGLANLTKAKVIVETGTYTGDTAMSLAYAASLYGGHVYTAETDPLLFAQCSARVKAEKRWVAASPSEYGAWSVTCFNTTGVDLIQHLGKGIDLAFLDSSIEARADELRALYPNMSPGGVVVIHDVAPHHATMGYLGSLKGWNYLRFRTPRGLLVLQRTEDVSAVVL